MITTGIAAWLLGPQIMGFVFLILGLVQHFFPPKKINNWYGYRTYAAQKNQQTWDEGNRYSAIYMIKCGIVVFIAGVVITMLLNLVTMPPNVHLGLVIFLVILSGMAPPILMIISTEKHLTKTFGDK